MEGIDIYPQVQRVARQLQRVRFMGVLGICKSRHGSCHSSTVRLLPLNWTCPPDGYP